MWLKGSWAGETEHKHFLGTPVHLGLIEGTIKVLTLVNQVMQLGDINTIFMWGKAK